MEELEIFIAETKAIINSQEIPLQQKAEEIKEILADQEELLSLIKNQEKPLEEEINKILQDNSPDHTSHEVDAQPLASTVPEVPNTEDPNINHAIGLINQTTHQFVISPINTTRGILGLNNLAYFSLFRKNTGPEHAVPQESDALSPPPSPRLNGSIDID
jgi:hypothetical protein